MGWQRFVPRSRGGSFVSKLLAPPCLWGRNTGDRAPAGQFRHVTKAGPTAPVTGVHADESGWAPTPSGHILNHQRLLPASLLTKARCQGPRDRPAVPKIPVSHSWLSLSSFCWYITQRAIAVPFPLTLCTSAWAYEPLRFVWKAVSVFSF